MDAETVGERAAFIVPSDVGWTGTGRAFIFSVSVSTCERRSVHAGIPVCRNPVNFRRTVVLENGEGRAPRRRRRHPAGAAWTAAAGQAVHRRRVAERGAAGLGRRRTRPAPG